MRDIVGCIDPTKSPVERSAERVFELSCRAETGAAQMLFKMEKSKGVEARHTVNMSVDEAHCSQTSPVDIYGKDSYPHADMNRLQRFG